MAMSIAPISDSTLGNISFIRNSQSEKKVQQIQEKATIPEIKEHLDSILKETRITYKIDEDDSSFIIKVMDIKTDKVIKEIPSHDIQVLRKHFKEQLGIIFDELI